MIPPIAAAHDMTASAPLRFLRPGGGTPAPVDNVNTDEKRQHTEGGDEALEVDGDSEFPKQEARQDSCGSANKPSALFHRGAWWPFCIRINSGATDPIGGPVGTCSESVDRVRHVVSSVYLLDGEAERFQSNRRKILKVANLNEA
jgi:hypothetical protein